MPVAPANPPTVVRRYYDLFNQRNFAAAAERQYFEIRGGQIVEAVLEFDLDEMRRALTG